MADEVKKSIKDEMNRTPSCIPAKWNRFTVADGDWMQAKTLDQLMNRDDFLADKIGEGNSGWKDDLSSESAARYYDDQYLSASISSLSGEFYTFSADDYLPTVTSLSSLLNYAISRATLAENNLSGRISIEETARSAADAKLQKQIDSDFDSLSSTVANNYLSANENAVSAGKNILIDYDENNPKITIKTDENVNFNNVSSKNISATNVTALTAQGNIAKFTNLSATNLNNIAISNLFGSAYSGAAASAWIYANSAILDIQPGYGLATGINEEEHKVIGINQAHCAYNKYGLALGTYCSAYSISIGNASFAFGESCYITGGQGTFAAGSNVNITGKFSCGLGDTSNINGNYSYSIGEHNNLTSDRQYAFGQGLSGNSFMIGRYNEVEPKAQFVIGGGTTGAHEVTSHKNLLVIKNDVISARDFSAGDVSLSSLTNMSAFGNGITDTATYNLSAVKLSAGQGIGFKNDTNGVLSISAEGTTYQDGDYISTANKTIAVTGDLITSAEAGSAASAWINSKNSTIAFTTNFKGSNNVITGYGTSSFSAGESYIDGNYIHIDTSNNSINLASSISSTNISAKNINADSGFFNYLRGETLQGVTSSIDVDELISAVSSITGESNIYVRKDELECEIGSANSAIKQSFAQGKSNRANENSFVQGNLNNAVDGSFAQGDSNSSNIRAFAQGYSNTAYYESFAQGQINRVSNYSMGQGQENSATNCSIAQGIHNATKHHLMLYL